jgi:hypothetical protein
MHSMHFMPAYYPIKIFFLKKEKENANLLRFITQNKKKKKKPPPPKKWNGMGVSGSAEQIISLEQMLVINAINLCGTPWLQYLLLLT